MQGVEKMGSKQGGSPMIRDQNGTNSARSNSTSPPLSAQSCEEVLAFSGDVSSEALPHQPTYFSAA